MNGAVVAPINYGEKSMNNSHLYQRLNNPQVVKTYLNMIKIYELDIVNALFGNLTLEANDHPKYKLIQEAYNARMLAENNKN